jgi:uncharacterized membrane protein
MLRLVLVFAIVLNLWASGGVAAEQVDVGVSEPTSSIQIKGSPALKERRDLPDDQAKEREWKKKKKELEQLESVIDEESRFYRQANRECEAKNKGDSDLGKTMDVNEITRQLGAYKKRLRECIALKEGCEAAITGFSGLSQKLQFELQEQNNEYSRCMKAIREVMRKDSDTKDDVPRNIKG